MKINRRARLRTLSVGRKIVRCPKCQAPTHGLTRHLVEAHKVPLVRLGQGEYAREYHGERSKHEHR
jgi:hypothetical protein